MLVLELGGQSEPLREALRRVARVEVTTREEVTREEEPREEVTREEPVAGVAPPSSEFFTVYLREGETLYRLAATHLGRGSRWRELLALNGWTEAEATRLKVGVPVKLPIR
jgi:hypothetical protein